jgi:hypothetical protein
VNATLEYNTENDKVNMTTVASERPKSRENPFKFGIDGYYAPNNNWMFHKPQTLFWSNQKKENIIEYEARIKKDLPGP